MRKLIFFGLFVLGASLHAADTAPDWVREVSGRALPAYPSEVRSVTLLDEARASIDATGRTINQLRQALRVTKLEGRSDAIASISYLKGNSKIRDFRAWLVEPNGFVKTYGKDDVVDIAMQENFELYDELRVRFIKARNPEVGATFAWSAELEESPLVPQTIWSFQGREPVLLSRCTITLPAGWTAKSTTFNHAAIEPHVDGTTFTWELRDLPLIKKEPGSPRLSSLAPRLGITFIPPDSNPNGRKLSTWSDVSAWMSTLADPQAQASDAMAAKVKELIAPAKTDYERIQAIGHYVQNIKYVAIEINLASGGGYQPHLASDVFARQYGDCKDKANLMRAMLKVAGIDSYLVNLFSGDRHHVRPEWASPYQFNHAIIAVKVGDEVSAQPVLADPSIGRLLFFDPTDDSTPVGDLPDDEQGSFALIVAGGRGGIVQVPSAPPETNRSDVTVTSTLSETGELDANVTERDQGQHAASLRRRYSHDQPADFQKEIEAWLVETAKEVNLTQFAAKDAFETEQFGLDIAFKAPSYAQIMQQRLLVFRPLIVQRWNGFAVQTDPRTTPVELDAGCYHKQVRVKLPASFKVDEMPDDAKFSAPFGKYASNYKLEGGDLLFTEELDILAATIPAERYPEVKKFFEQVAGAEQAPLVLVKN
jgi:transglutaminase-like putative cysteine protease